MPAAARPLDALAGAYLADALAAAFLAAFASATRLALHLLPAPFGVLVPVALAAVALFWILR